MIKLIVALIMGVVIGAVIMTLFYLHQKKDTSNTSNYSEILDKLTKVGTSVKELNDKVSLISCDISEDLKTMHKDIDAISLEIDTVHQSLKEYKSKYQAYSAGQRQAISSTSPGAQTEFAVDSVSVPQKRPQPPQPKELTLEQVFKLVEQLRQENTIQYCVYNLSTHRLEYSANSNAPYIMVNNQFIFPNQVNTFKKTQLTEDVYKCNSNFIRSENKLRPCRADNVGNILQQGEIF